MDSSKTVWMGNIDNTINEQFIRKMFKSLSKVFIYNI
jgi:RNA recognition motif-containing protein